MDLDALKEIFEGFDIAAFLPQLDSLMGWVETLLRLCVMAGPLILLGFGLLYLLAPPKEANYSLGYRFWWSMASLDAWQFTHRLVGCVWTPLGLLLAVFYGMRRSKQFGLKEDDIIQLGQKCRQVKIFK